MKTGLRSWLLGTPNFVQGALPPPTMTACSQQNIN